jgi:hypothetical protein
MESMLAMDEMVGESFRKMNQEVKSVRLAVFMRGETTFASMSACERMKQEVNEAFLKRRREHPKIFHVSSNAGGGISKTELGDVNFATWVGASRSEGPLLEDMREHLIEMNICSEGKWDVVRRCFKRNVRRDSVCFSDQQWQICNALPKVGIDNRVILKGGVSLLVKENEGIGVTLEKENLDSLKQPVDQDDFGSDPGR